jgi:hypothetical protein
MLETIQSIHSTDLLIASAATLLFVGPIAYHLASDVHTRRTRHFSLIPHSFRHALRCVFSVGLIGAAAVLSSNNPDTSTVIWSVLLALLLGLSLAGVSDRRLYINADTGLITWQRISWPWATGRRKATFVDAVSGVRFKSSDRTMNLLGIARLEQHWTVNYNGSVSSSGHYSRRTLETICDRVNDYLRAFRRYDSEEKQTRRAAFRERVEVARAPRQKRIEQRRLEAERAQAEKANQLEREREARKAKRESERERKLEEKFSA